jgi:hypothetical protein
MDLTILTMMKVFLSSSFVYKVSVTQTRSDWTSNRHGSCTTETFVDKSRRQQNLHGCDDIFYAVSAIQSKAIPYSIRKFMVGFRTSSTRVDERLHLSLQLFPFLHARVLDEGRRRFLKCRRLALNVNEDDIAWVVERYPKVNLSLSGIHTLRWQIFFWALWHHSCLNWLRTF